MMQKRDRNRRRPWLEVLEDRTAPAVLIPGDFLVADQSAFGATGAVFEVDPATGTQTTISSHGYFGGASGFIALAADGSILVDDPAAFGGPGVIRVNPSTGAQSIVSSGGNFVEPLGLAIAPNGDIFVADRNAFGGGGGIIRVNPLTGAQATISTGGSFADPTGIAIAQNGDLYVVDGGSRAVIRVDPASGGQTVVSQGGDFVDPALLAIAGNGDLIVADQNAFGGPGGIIRVNPSTGAQTTISFGGSFKDPYGVAFAPNGDILVADHEAFGGGGGIIRVNPTTGAQTTVSSGGNFVAPTGIAVVPGGAVVAPPPGIAFAPAVNYPVGTEPSTEVVGDFNNDGKIDIVTANKGDSTISVLLGHGDATFTSGGTYGTGTHPYGLAAADLNRDGKLDVVTANHDSNNVTVLLGNGDGSFQAPVGYAVPFAALMVTSGDFNGDGKLDLAVANNVTLGSPSVISILLGNGNGTFQPAVNYNVGLTSYWVTAADLNGDGKLDLITANHSSGDVSVLLGNGDGTFQPAVSYAAGVGPTKVVVADLNNDGKPDLAVSNFYSQDITILLGHGDGTFQGVIDYYRFEEGSGNTIVDSVNGLTEGTHNAAYSTNVPLIGRANDFSLQFSGTNVARFPSQNFIFNSSFGNATLGFWLNAPQEVHTTIFWTRPDDTDANRFNISINPNGALGFDYRTPSGILHTMLLGDGSFSVPLDTWTHIVITRTVDSSTSDTYRFYENGVLGYTATDTNPDLPTSTTWTLADRTPGAGHTKFVGLIDEIQFSDTVLSRAAIPEGTPITNLAVGDFNGDGKPDLVTANHTNGNVGILLGNGDGTFQAPIFFTAGTAAEDVVPGDFNGDGRLDLSVSNAISNNVSVLINQTPRPAPSSFSGFAWQDFNNDGQIDFGESGIAGVTVMLRGSDGSNMTTTTDTNGFYQFTSLAAANYYVTATQPAGYTAGIDSVGTVNGVATGSVSGVDQFFVNLAVGVDAINYNFGQLPVNGSAVTSGQTAGIGFWNNKHGQALIKSLNGGQNATQLGNWLAATFTNIFGANAGGHDVAGLTNAQVAAAFQQDFMVKGPKLDAQVMATALSVYVTNQTLAGTTATAYGFKVTQDGVGIATFNVGGNGAAVAQANNTTMSVIDMLFALDALSKNDSGLLYGGDALLRKEANDLFSAINGAGSL